MCVRLRGRTEQLSSHWTDFHEILYLRIFRNRGKIIQVSLNSEDLTGISSEENYRLVIISLPHFFLEWQMFQTKAVVKMKTDILCSVAFFFFFCENLAVYEITWKYIAERCRAHYGACAVYAGCLRLQTHTKNIKNLLLPHCYNGCTNAPPCNFIRVLAVRFLLSLVDTMWGVDNKL